MCARAVQMGYLATPMQTPMYSRQSGCYQERRMIFASCEGWMMQGCLSLLARDIHQADRSGAQREETDTYAVRRTKANGV